MDTDGALSEPNAAKRFAMAVADVQVMAAPPTLGGCGVVICGGGRRYLPSVWVCVNMLRHFGCKLPIELWHFGQDELPAEFHSPLEDLGVTCIDAIKMREKYPVRTLNGWELKPFAVLHSAFQEVLLLDADNAPIVDPSFLFQTKPYLEHGAIFWPDFGRLSRERLIWRLTGIPYREEPEFETGQIVVDKARVWRELNLAMWMNEHSDFWYRHIHGDKDTFHMAWRGLETAYAMPTRPIEPLVGTMCQHDFEGRRIFQHRNLRKWKVTGNDRVFGFRFEEECLSYLSKLPEFARGLYGASPLTAEDSEGVMHGLYHYHRVGHDRRVIELLPNGSVGRGSDRMERFWGIRSEGAAKVLELYGEDGLTARLLSSEDGPTCWRGFWVIHEQMPVELTYSQTAARERY